MLRNPSTTIIALYINLQKRWSIPPFKMDHFWHIKYYFMHESKDRLLFFFSLLEKETTRCKSWSDNQWIDVKVLLLAISISNHPLAHPRGTARWLFAQFTSDITLRNGAVRRPVTRNFATPRDLFARKLVGRTRGGNSVGVNGGATGERGFRRI